MKNLDSNHQQRFNSTDLDVTENCSSLLPALSNSYLVETGDKGKFSEHSDVSSSGKHTTYYLPNDSLLLKASANKDLGNDYPIKKSKSLTKKIKELCSIKSDLNSVKSNLFPIEHEKSVNQTNGIPPLAFPMTNSSLSNEIPHTPTLQPLSARSVGGNLSGNVSPLIYTSAKHSTIPSIDKGIQADISGTSNVTTDLTRSLLTSTANQLATQQQTHLRSNKLVSIPAAVINNSRKNSFSEQVVINDTTHQEPVRRVYVATDSSSYDGSKGDAAEEVVSMRNDRLISDRLQEAKALSRRNDHGAVMHTFSLWKKPPQQAPDHGQSSQSGDVDTQHLLKSPRNSSKVLRGPKAAISQLASTAKSGGVCDSPSHEISDDFLIGNYSKSGKKEPRSSNKTRLFNSLLSDTAVPMADVGSSIEGLPAGSQSIEVQKDDEDGEDEVSLADNWSNYSSDFENAFDNDRVSEQPNFSDETDAVVGLNSQQRGLASSLRNRIVDAKTIGSLPSPVDHHHYQDMSTAAVERRLSKSLPIGGFSVAMSNDMSVTDVSSSMSFSQTLDATTLSREISTNFAQQANDNVEIVGLNTLRSQSVQLLNLPDPEQRSSRGRSTSIGNHGHATGGMTVHSRGGPLVSVTARPAVTSIPLSLVDGTTLTPVKTSSGSNSNNEQIHNVEQLVVREPGSSASKYQILRQLKQQDGNVTQKHGDNLLGTSFESVSKKDQNVIYSTTERGETVSAEDIGDNRELFQPSPTLSEISDPGEDLRLTLNRGINDRAAHEKGGVLTAFEQPTSLTIPGNSPEPTNEKAESLMASDSQGSVSPVQWKKGEAIGEGTFGKVFKGLNEKTGELLAIKQLCIADGSEHEVESLQREILVMKDLRCEFIVRYLGTSRSDRYLYIILEYVTGGSIASMLTQFGAFSENLIKRFTLQIVSGVDYLHAKGIIHRDIKGANILVTEGGVAKLADFGCSKQLVGMCTTSLEESLRAIRGSVPWMAPEVIKQSGHGRAADIWSVGATIIEMATAKPPWPEFTSNLAALFHMATSKEPPSIPTGVSDVCANFIQRCLVIEPSARATTQELLQLAFLLSGSEKKVTSAQIK